MLTGESQMPKSSEKGKPSKKPKNNWKTKPSLPLAFVSFLLRLFFEPEDGNDMILRNVGFHPNCTTLQPQKTVLFIIIIYIALVVSSIPTVIVVVKTYFEVNAIVSCPILTNSLP
jgi:hypothetical protein